MSDVFVRQATLPLCVKGQVLLDEDGNYNVYINSKYPYESQVEALKHELRHIKNDDFAGARPIRDVERLPR